MKKISTVIVEEICDYASLYDYLQDAFRVLHISYTNILSLKKENKYQKPESAERWFLEDEITDDLIVDEFNFEKRLDYSILPQYKNIKAKSRIDIAVHCRLDFGKYYNIEIECKLLKKNNINYIIDGGITKFKTNKYSEKLPLAGMLFYNTEGLIDNNIELLKQSIEKKINQDEILKQTEIFENFSFSYQSKHERINNDDIDLYSCAFDFSSVIKRQEQRA